MSKKTEQWAKINNEFFEGGEAHAELPAGMYEIEEDLKGAKATLLPMKTEDLLVFSDSPVDMLMNELERFWASRKKYDDLGLAWRRGFMLEGPPGNGKTGIVQLVAKRVVDRGGLAIVSTPDEAAQIMPFFCRVEETREVVFILEDIDESLRYSERDVLQMLDGVTETKPGMVFIATTNHFDTLSDRIKKRPSRFDTILHVGMPGETVREQYTSTFPVIEEEKVKIVSASQGMSLAQLKEMIIARYVYGQKLSDIRSRLLGNVEDEERSSSPTEEAVGSNST